MYKKILLVSAFVFSSQIATAKDLQSTIADPNITPEEKGLAIAIEADKRDLGFKDSRVDLKMTLVNQYGESVERFMETKTLENTRGEEYGDKSVSIFKNPEDIKGTAVLNHTKVLEPDNQWLYLPALKRVKRISSKNKSGAFVGSDFSYEDLQSQEVAKYTYKYINTEACGDMMCYIVESYPAYEYSGYTRRIASIDTKELRPMKIVFYDRKNDILKTLNYTDYNSYNLTNQFTGKPQTYWRAGKMKMVNATSGKYTTLEFTGYKFGNGYKDSDFVKSRLTRIR